MTRIITKCKLQKMIILCIGCLFLSLSIMKLNTSAQTGSPYYIKVNKQQNCVTVYGKDKTGKYTKPVKAMTCSTGVDTPLGTYHTLAKYRWKLLMGDVWGQYSTRIVDGILFHSVWYYKMDETTLSATQYNKLGTAASHGCVRLAVADSKWIYDNCPVGTSVEIYNSKDPGPLGKPETVKIPVGSGWDPTDPSTNNPYKDKAPTFKGVMNKSITWGKKTSLLSGVKAASTTGEDITSKIKVTGKIDIYKTGKYKVKYTVTDAIGRTTSKTVTYTVNQCKEKPRILGVTDQVIGTDTVVDKKYALKGVTAYLSTKKLLSSDINVKITKKSEDTYTIDYSIKAENKLTGKAQAVIHVDNTPPVIEGIYFKEITQKQLETGAAEIKKLALKGIKVEDNYSKLSTDKVKVTVKKKDDYSYFVTYELMDNVGNVTSETVQFTYFKGIRIDGVANHFNLPDGTAITEDFVKQGITAVNSDNEECTDTMSVAINSTDNKVFKVTYSVKDKDGSEVTIVSYYTVNGEAGQPEENTDTVKENSDKVTENTDNGDINEDVNQNTVSPDEDATTEESEID